VRKTPESHSPPQSMTELASGLERAGCTEDDAEGREVCLIDAALVAIVNEPGSIDPFRRKSETCVQHSELFPAQRSHVLVRDP
jgi:hypothetical protein